MPHITLRNDLYGITSLLDYRKEAARPLCELTDVLLSGASTLTKAERELVASYVSWLNDCRFCSTAHGAITCEMPEGTAGMVEAARTGAHSDGISDKMRHLLAIAAAVQKSGREVTQQHIDEAKKHGATDLEIHDTVLIAALFCLYNRYVDGLATVAPADSAFYTALAKRVAARGYKMPEDGYHQLKV